MIGLLDLLSFLLNWTNAVILFLILHTFLSVRKNLALQIAAVLSGPWLFNAVVYSNDLPGVL